MNCPVQLYQVHSHVNSIVYKAYWQCVSLKYGLIASQITSENGQPYCVVARGPLNMFLYLMVP